MLRFNGGVELAASQPMRPPPFGIPPDPFQRHTTPSDRRPTGLPALASTTLLAVYSAGLGIPFLLAAFMVEQFSALFARMKRHLANVERAMGVLLVITGIGFLTGAVSGVSIWLLETFPQLQNFG